MSRIYKKLEGHSLLRKIGDGVYILTERGERHLDGEINTYGDQSDEMAESDEDSVGLPSPGGVDT